MREVYLLSQNSTSVVNWKSPRWYNDLERLRQVHCGPFQEA